MYGQSSNVDLNVTQDKTIVLEYAELLNINDSNQLPNGLPLKSVDGNVQPDSDLNLINNTERFDNQPATPNKTAIKKQFETRAKDGRRRITPVFIPLEQDEMLVSLHIQYTL